MLGHNFGADRQAAEGSESGAVMDWLFCHKICKANYIQYKQNLIFLKNISKTERHISLFLFVKCLVTPI